MEKSFHKSGKIILNKKKVLAPDLNDCAVIAFPISLFRIYVNDRSRGVTIRMGRRI